MSFNTTIEVSYGMKYDLSNLIRSSLTESYSEYKTKQLEIRNLLIQQNKLEKRRSQTQKINLFVIDDYKIMKKRECIIDLSEDKFIPKGYYCYPIKGAYFQKSAFEMSYFPYLPFKQFQEGIKTYESQKSLSESYLAYPCLPEKDYEKIKLKIKNLNEKSHSFNNNNKNNSNTNDLAIRPIRYTSNLNKYFIIWSFIKIFRGQMVMMDEDFKKLYSKDKNKIIIPILIQMVKYFNIDINILYHIIITFLKQCNKKLCKNSLLKRGITYKKYEKYWCRICNRFFCPFHFKIKVKCKTLNNGSIRTTEEYFKKIQVTLKPPEYLLKENEESEINKKQLESDINQIISNCPCCNKVDANDNFVFDESLRFNKMAKISNKEDFFVLCKIIQTCNKFLNADGNGVYSSILNNYSINIDDFLSPCVLRKILHDKYDCNLIRYLVKLITNNKYLNDINLFLKSLSGVSYENLSEENLMFFNDTKIIGVEQKYTEKGEKKIIKIPRIKQTARQQIKSDKNLFYKPCDHYPAECTPENCACAKLGICLKYCGCFKKTILGDSKARCKYLLLGCYAHNKTASCSGCICALNNMECIPGLCKCKEKCTNNNVTLGKRKKLIYGFSHRIKGGGLFAGENIKSGEFIDVYEGEIVEKEELDRLSVFYDQTGNNYPFDINSKFDFVAIKCGGLTRFINHGAYDEENIRADKIMVNGIPYIAFYAERDIMKFEELYYNYSYNKNSMPDWMKEYNRQMESMKKKEKNNKTNRKQTNNRKPNTKKNKERTEDSSQKLNKSINLDEDYD